MADRLEWREGKYSAVSGYAGGIGLFGISYRTQREAPTWSMRTDLPGLLSKTWQDDDKDALKGEAERVLARWLSRVGG